MCAESKSWEKQKQIERHEKRREALLVDFASSDY